MSLRNPLKISPFADIIISNCFDHELWRDWKSGSDMQPEVRYHIFFGLEEPPKSFMELSKFAEELD